MNTGLAFEWLMSQFDVERLGWVLVHSLWQLTVVALLAGTTIRALRGKSSGLRYGVLVVAMAVAVAAPPATWFLLQDDLLSPVAGRVVITPEHSANNTASAEADSFPVESDTKLSEIPLPADLVPLETRPAELVQTPAAVQLEPSWLERAKMALRPWLAWIVVAWSLGVVVCSARPLFGWHVLWRFRRVGVSPVPDDVLAAMSRVSQQLGLRDAVRILQSSLTRVPIVVGYFCPVVLLPVSLVTSIPITQLEAILAHELAHVRRHDFVVNLAQTLAETFFFYHPAVWWISHQIRIEREHCCDDIVVNLLGDRVEYGRALVAVEQLRSGHSALALSVGGGSLLSRIRRLASGPVTESRRAAWCGSVVAILICAIGCTMLFSSNLDALVKTEYTRVGLPDGSTVGVLGVTSDGIDPAQWWRADGQPLDASPLTGHRTTSQPDWGTRRRFAVRSTGAKRVAWFFPGDGRYQSSGSEGDRPDYLYEQVIAPRAIPLLEPITLQCGVGEGDFGPWSTIGFDGNRESVPKMSPELALYYQQILLSVVIVEDNAANITLTHPTYKYIADQEWAVIAKDGRRLPWLVRSDFSSSKYEITFSVPPGGIDRIEFRLRPYRHWVTFENVSLRRGQKTKVKVATVPPRPEAKAMSESVSEDAASQQPSYVATILTERRPGEKAEEQRDNGPGVAKAGDADVIRGLGTGIVIDKQGYIATMQHLIRGMSKVRVRLSGDRTYEARIVASDIKRDIAVLKIDPPQPLEIARFGKSSTLQKTDRVTTFGSGHGRGSHSAKGTVTELGQLVEVNPQVVYSNLIQTDFNIHPGHSGGPLMNSNGQVVGVMVALRAGTQKVSFALPIDDLLPVFKRIVEADAGNVRKDGNEAPNAAAISRPVSPTLVLPDHLNVVAVGFDRDGTELVSLSTENDVAVRVWAPDLTLRAWYPGKNRLIREVKLDTDKHGNIVLQGQPLLSGDRQRVIAILDGQVTIWDANSGKHLKTLVVPQEMRNSLLRGLTATPDLSLIACSRAPGFSGIDSADAAAIVWDVAAGRVRRTVSHARALQIQSLALSSDGKFLATGGMEAGLCLWDISTGKLMYQLPNDNAGRKHPSLEVSAAGANQVLCLRFSPDGQKLALGDMLGVKMLETKSGKLLFQCDAPFRYGRSGLVFSKDGQLLARIATDKIVPIWSAHTGKLLVELPTEAHDGAFSDDSRSFAVGFTDQKQGLAVWKLSGDGAQTDANSAPAKKFLAKLPNGHSVEFVGMTRNTAPAKSGWRPDGRKMGAVPEFKVSLGGPSSGGTFSDATPPEDVNARDFLFEFQGLRDQPSINFEIPFGRPIYAQEPIRDSQLRIRVLASLQDKETPFPDSASNLRPHDLRVGLTDEPWGPWQQISATGQILNNLGKNKLYQSHYSQIGFRPGSGGGLPDDTLLILRHPKQHDRIYAFEMRAIDTEGEVVRGLDWRRRVVEGTALEDFGWYLTQPLPKGKQIARFEYRLRPYRHLVTFENVSLVPGNQTDVKIRTASIPEEKPGTGLEVPDSVRDATTAPLPKDSPTAWGKAVGGLQAGLSITNPNDIPIGGKATVVLRLRNVSNEPITTSAWPLWLIKPMIVDGAGKLVPTTSPSSPGFDLSTTPITLKPGQTVVVATNNIFVEDVEAKGGVRHEGVADQFTIHVRPGRHRVDFKGFLEGHQNVATGSVDFEVKMDKNEKPNGPATKPNNGPEL